LRFVRAAHPDHALHRLGRRATTQDLRNHRQLVVRETGSLRATPTSIEATQRWTVSNMSTSIIAARSGYGYAWFPEDKIRDELADGTLKPLPMLDADERYVELYLVYADRDAAGPGTIQLAEIITELVRSECSHHGLPAAPRDET
jgi:DNA-binding transcriptional LysR family regulator